MFLVFVPKDFDDASIQSGLSLLNARPRQLLFFDEILVGYIISDHQVTTEDAIINIDISIVPQDSFDNNSYANFNLGDLTVNKSNLIFNDDEYLIWKFEFPLIYPKKKLTNPNLLISCHLQENSQPIESHTIINRDDQDRLPNFIPGFQKNLISELNDSLDSNPNDLQFYLSPSTTNNNSQESIVLADSQTTASIRIPVVISLVLKMKTTKPAGRNNMLLASLNLESSEELINSFHDRSHEDYYFQIIDLIVEFKFGHISNFTTENYQFPFNFKSFDMINFTYKLINNEILDSTSKSEISKHLNIKLILQVQRYDPGTKSYTNVSNIITTSWTPYIDFFIIAPPINHSLKTSTSSSHMQSQPVLPSQGKITNNRKAAMLNNYKMKSPMNANNSMSTPTLNGSASFPNGTSFKRTVSSNSSVTVNLTTNTNSSLSGIKLTFRGKLSMNLGEIVNWKLQAINNSNNRTNLSLLVQNNHNYHPVSSNDATSTTKSSNDSIIQSPSQLYTTYMAQKLTTNGIIILDNDIRLGPLEPHGVFETEIKLLGISRGIYNLEGIKIFDITTGDGLDFGKLVEVFVI